MNDGSDIYLDHAATSYPKAAGVVAAITQFFSDVGVNPGRAGYGRAAAAARIIFSAREAAARLFGVPDSRRLVFLPNATSGLNLALRGLLRPGDHVVATSMEHNAVMRPLRWLRDHAGVSVSLVRADALGRVAPGDVAAALTPATRLVVVNHASNVCGTVQPLAAIKDAVGRLPLLVDAAQSAGHVPIDVTLDGLDGLAFTGHKALGGPPGSGGLWLREGLEPEPLVLGGTGSSSASEEAPAVWPDRHEAGTPNAPAIAGLGAALGLLAAAGGVAATQALEAALFERLWEGLSAVPDLRLFGPPPGAERTPTLSVTLTGRSPSEVGLLLEREHGVLVRVGLHCAPEAHRTLGTFPAGTVRLALGRTNSAGDVDAVVAAFHAIAAVRP